MSVNIGTFNFKKALYYLIPISAYFAGAVISELMPKYTTSAFKMRWDTFFIGFEMLAFSGIAFIPDDAPPQICQVLINFIASMQYNTFRAAHGHDLLYQLSAPDRHRLLHGAADP